VTQSREITVRGRYVLVSTSVSGFQEPIPWRIWRQRDNCQDGTEVLTMVLVDSRWDADWKWQILVPAMRLGRLPQVNLNEQ